MRQLLLNSIEIKRIIDVGSTTYFYLLIPSAATAPNKPADNSAPPIYETEGYSGWSETEPRYTSGDTRSLYVTIRTTYSDGSCKYTTPSLSSSYEAAKQAYNRAQSALSLADGINNYFWWLTSSTDSDIPTGAYVTNIPRTSFETNKTGGNIVIQSTGITIRNGIDTLASLSGQALNFYETNNGYLTMSLNGNSLNFYNPTNNNNDISAQLNAGGLVLKKGGIESGSVTSGNGYVYLSTEDKSGITINNHTPDANDQNDPKWRQIIGSNFGVTSDGTLYASNANVRGTINATSGSITGNVSIGGNVTIADSVTIGGKEQSYYLNSNINIGGRNLLKESDIANPVTVSGVLRQYIGNGWWKFSGTLSLTDASRHALYMGPTTTFGNTNLGGAGEYTLTNWAENFTFSSSTMYIRIYLYSDENPLTNTRSFNCTAANSNITFTVPSGEHIGGIALYFNTITSGTNLNNKYLRLKLESGNQSTDWTPAPEDIEGGGSRNYAQTNFDIGTFSNTNGILATITDYNTITLDGTATTRFVVLPNEKKAFGGLTLSPGVYKVWFTNTDGANCWPRIGYGEESTYLYSIAGEYTKDSPFIFNVLTEDIYYVGIAVENGAIFDNFTTSIMFEKGATTDWSLATEDTTVNKYITTINNNGIQIHAANTTNNYIQLNNSGMEIYNDNLSIASYGETSRIGLSSGARFIIDSSQLQAYNSDGKLYFQVTSEGIFFGGKEVAVQKEVDNQIIKIQEDIIDASKTASSFITSLGSNGIKIHDIENVNLNYIHINSSVIAMYRNGNNVMQITNDSLRLGQDSDSHILLDTSLSTPELGFWNGSTKVAYINSNKLNIDNSEIENTLQIGEFMWKVHPTTNNIYRISLVYVPQ